MSSRTLALQQSVVAVVLYSTLARSDIGLLQVDREAKESSRSIERRELEHERRSSRDSLLTSISSLFSTSTRRERTPIH